ncbi:MAG TPA: hypothetical protein VN643_13085 [Pyrinomonadaceae bacterium]|nr:hypothetical protein [Pyrinomonadaceae bacterium]
MRTRSTVLPRLIVGALICFFAFASFAQSGRRGAKSPAIPVPTPEEKKAEPKPSENLTKIPVLVGASRNDVFTGIPFSIYDSVLHSCAQRLQESSAVRVQPDRNGFSRAEAVNRAKAAKEGYVVYLNLRGDDLSGGYATNLDAIFIEYSVFEHTTAKIRANGNAYQGAYRAGGVVLGPNSRGSSTAVIENRLRIAAEDAAERILKALHLASASDVPQP